DSAVPAEVEPVSATGLSEGAEGTVAIVDAFGERELLARQIDESERAARRAGQEDDRAERRMISAKETVRARDDRSARAPMEDADAAIVVANEGDAFAAARVGGEARERLGRDLGASGEIADEAFLVLRVRNERAGHVERAGDSLRS